MSRFSSKRLWRLNARTRNTAEGRRFDCNKTVSMLLFRNAIPVNAGAKHGFSQLKKADVFAEVLMGAEEKVVARFRDGRIVKGHVERFSIESDAIVLKSEKTGEEQSIAIEELKAIFFVKSFQGVSEHVEKKSFGIRWLKGRRVFVKFLDKESLVGCTEGTVPWDKGFSLAKLGAKAKGFFLIPVDGDCNNVRIFVVGSAIKDIQIMV